MSRIVTIKRDISPILINQRVTSYRLDSFDKIQVRLILNNKGKLSYLKNIPVEFYLNYTSSFIKYVDTTTDDNGIANIVYSCQHIEDNISSCAGYAKVTVDSIIYTSNLLRFNFCSGTGIEHETQLYLTDIILYSSDVIHL